jgi:hypothetical protein
MIILNDKRCRSMICELIETIVLKVEEYLRKNEEYNEDRRV